MLFRSTNIHALVVAVVAAIMLAVWWAGQYPEQQANAAGGEQSAAVAALSMPMPNPATMADHIASAPQLPDPVDAIAVRVQPGDNLAKIFQRHGISSGDLQILIDSAPLGARLTEIYPGHQFEIQRDDDGNLLHLKYRLGRLEALEFERSGDTFQGREILVEPERVRTYTHGTIEQSLYYASQRAGLSDAFAGRMANIFQWDIDFIHDIRPGDEFHLLYNKHYVGNQFVGFGDILAVEIVNRNKRYRAIRYSTDTGDFGYFTPEGRNLRKAFRRSPLEYSRISSNFNLKRVHPLWKSSMPHRGIDYAAPRGTPVMAAGDGKVVTASRTSANGNFIVLQHGRRYQTKYLHLSRFASTIRKGKQVQQGDIIGYVGATGWATGPHLHYEFLVDGVHKNPRTVPLPSGEPVPQSERQTFAAVAALLISDLDEEKRNRQVALANTAAADTAVPAQADAVLSLQ